MAEMTRSDAELVYERARQGFRSDIEADAYTHTLTMWQNEEPEGYDQLEAAYDDDESSFEWESIFFERRVTGPNEGQGDFVPLTGVEAYDEPDIDELASDFAWDYLDNIRTEIRERQEATDYSPREFVALVLDAAENCPEDDAHRVMDVSLGNYRGKKGKVREKLQQAEETVRITERVRA